MKLKHRIAAVVAVATVFALAPVEMQLANATPGDPHRVTICHRTRSTTHPYVRITVDSASVDGDTGNDHGQGDHNAEHQGPVATSTSVAEAIKNMDPPYDQPPFDGFWGDIIPPFYSDGLTPGYWPSLNWDSDGQTVFGNGCAVEGEGQTGSLKLTKTIPSGILEGEETVTIHFVLTVSGGDPGTPADVVAECDFVFDSTGNSQDCVISNLPFGTYDLWETDSGGFTPMSPNPLSVTIPDANDNPDVTVKVDNTFGPATADACKVTDVAGTGHDASGDSFTLDLVEDGTTVVDSVTLAGGGTPADPVCHAFDNAVLLDNHTYTIVEEDPATGWASDGGVCTVNGDPATSFTPQFPGDADALFSCTFTNSLTPAAAQVCKVTNVVNGAGFDPSTVTFTFHLSNGTTETKTVNGAGCVTFDKVLQDGVTYTITEDAVSGWTMGSGVGDCSFTVSYPGDSGKTFTCTFTNTKTFSAPLTPGYWKNHLNFDRKHPTAPYVAEFLPQCLGQTNSATKPIGDCITGGKYRVDTTTKAFNVFNVMNCNNLTTSSNNAVGCLAGHLLAAKFNVANGADATCIANYMNQADTFLATQPVPVYNGPGSYTLTAAKRATAIALKTKLDTFNNGGGCV